MNKIRNRLGVTLFELIVSILVGSIVLVTLTSTLAMITSANAKMQIESKMENESYIMTETLKHNIINLLDKSFTVSQDDADAFILEIHYCFINEEVQEKICTSSDANYDPHELMIDYQDNEAVLYFDGVRMHSTDLHLLGDSVISFSQNSTPISDDGETYSYGLLTLTLNMQLVLEDESILEPKEYTTEILFSRY